MNKYVWLGYVSRDTIMGQRKWLFGAYLKEICGPGQKQQNLRIRKSRTIWLIKIIRQIKVITQ